ncbi:MAG: 23S rRNA (adenine(2503)-C(2))-methyltransferase RlmN [Christensenellaceae bacterium]
MSTLLDLDYNELKDCISQIGEMPFRAAQIIKWLTAQKKFDEMTDLSAALRKKLKENFLEGYAKPLQILTSTDGTKKYLFEFPDKSTVESVLMHKNYGNTVCVSTQVGCRMGCVFCSSCVDGLKRNLSAGEILAQVLAVNADMGEGRNLTNIVLMGMGEPLDNYENVIKFIKLVNAPQSLNIGIRNISLSTCGLVEQIKKLADEKLSVTLSISLHAPNDEKRKQIMPTANKYSIKDILISAQEYFAKTGRRIIIEYAMIDGLNDTKEDAQELCVLLRQLHCHVNLIPLHKKDGQTLCATPMQKIYSFCKMLEEGGLSATIRKSMGEDIAGACGQLRQRYL